MNRFKEILTKWTIAILLITVVLLGVKGENDSLIESTNQPSFVYENTINRYVDNLIPDRTAYASYLTKFSGNNVISVGKDGNVDFNTIQGAIDSVSGATVDNRFVIVVGPGEYEENVVLSNYVDLTGSGPGKAAIITSSSGTTLTFSNTSNFVYHMTVKSTPTASGAQVVDVPVSGSHEMFTVFLDQTSSTNGITGNLITVSGDSNMFVTATIADYVMSGTSAGALTHEVFKTEGTAVLTAARSSGIAISNDIDDPVELFHDNSTGDSIFAQGDWRVIITNASYSGTSKVFAHYKTGVLKADLYSGVTCVGSGSGKCYGIYTDSDTNDAVITSGYNVIRVLGFDENKHTSPGLGDTINVSYDQIFAADGTNGDGTTNFVGTFATGQGLITGGALFTIDTTNEWHGFSTLTRDATTESNTIVTAGTSGAITAFADAGVGQITVTSTGHSLSENDYITITGTTNYNGVFQATNVLTNTFEITDTWVADDATGTLHRGTSVQVQQRGIYELLWSFSVESAGSNKFFDFVAFNGITEITGTEITRKFSGGGDVGSASGTPLIFAEKDDVIWFGFRNVTDSTNVTISEGSLHLSKAS